MSLQPGVRRKNSWPAHEAARQFGSIRLHRGAPSGARRRAPGGCRRLCASRPIFPGSHAGVTESRDCPAVHAPTFVSSLYSSCSRPASPVRRVRSRSRHRGNPPHRRLPLPRNLPHRHLLHRLLPHRLLPHRLLPHRLLPHRLLPHRLLRRLRLLRLQHPRLQPLRPLTPRPRQQRRHRTTPETRKPETKSLRTKPLRTSRRSRCRGRSDGRGARRGRRRRGSRAAAAQGQGRDLGRPQRVRGLGAADRSVRQHRRPEEGGRHRLRGAVPARVAPGHLRRALLLRASQASALRQHQGRSRPGRALRRQARGRRRRHRHDRGRERGDPLHDRRRNPDAPALRGRGRQPGPYGNVEEPRSQRGAGRAARGRRQRRRRALRLCPRPRRALHATRS